MIFFLDFTMCSQGTCPAFCMEILLQCATLLLSVYWCCYLTHGGIGEGFCPTQPQWFYGEFEHLKDILAWYEKVHRIVLSILIFYINKMSIFFVVHHFTHFSIYKRRKKIYCVSCLLTWKENQGGGGNFFLNFFKRFLGGGGIKKHSQKDFSILAILFCKHPQTDLQPA